MSDNEIRVLLAKIMDEVAAIKRCLAQLHISTGHTGNQWFTIPPPPTANGGNDGTRHGQSPGPLQPAPERC